MRVLIVIVVVAALAALAWLTRDRWLDHVQPASAPSEAPASSSEGTSTPAATPAAAADEPRDEQAVREQAERYVARLTQPEAEPVRVERADHFVTRDQVLSLVPETAVETTTLEKMRADPSVTPDTPITVVREVEQVERVTPEKLIARSGGKLDAPVQVLENQQVRETTVREVLERATREPDMPIDVVTRTEYFEQTTPRELEESGAARADEPLRVVRKGHGLEQSSIGDLMRTQAVSEDSLFYVRTVRPDDDQGIWGIVHDGIIENFARGMAIRRGKEINTYKVDIPRDADERRADESSSFLGKLIFRKTQESYVYNFDHNRMGRNPDRIFPGQEIVIINFEPEELIAIYRHFVEQRG